MGRPEQGCVRIRASMWGVLVRYQQIETLTYHFGKKQDVAFLRDN